MKKFIVILGIILTSGIAALALSNKKAPEASAISQVKIDKNELSAAKAQVNSTVKDNLTNAD